jgi:hypothetical protein
MTKYGNLTDMDAQKIDVARTIGDLAGMPVGTRIATNHNKIMEREDAWGRQYWIEPGTLSPYFEPLVHWLPAFILPPVQDPEAGQ